MKGKKQSILFEHFEHTFILYNVKAINQIIILFFGNDKKMLHSKFKTYTFMSSM